MRSFVLGSSRGKHYVDLLRRSVDELRQLEDKIAARLASIAKDIMLRKIPTHDIDGNITGRVVMEKFADGYRVSYMGQDVAYIEFGTGPVGSSHPYPNSEALMEAGWNYGHKRGWVYISKRDGSLRFSRGGMVGERPVFETAQEVFLLADGILKEMLK